MSPAVAPLELLGELPVDVKLTVTCPLLLVTVKTPDVPWYVVVDPGEGTDSPTAVKVGATDDAAIVTVRVVVVTPVGLVVVVVVVVVGVPLMMMLVSALCAGGGVVVEPAIVTPLGWPDALPPASAGWPMMPAAMHSRGRAAMRTVCATRCFDDFIIFQP